MSKPTAKRLFSLLISLAMFVIAAGSVVAVVVGYGRWKDNEMIKANAPRSIEIAMRVMRPNGTIDKATHTEYWALFPASVREHPEEVLAGRNFAPGMAYQKELWESIRLSVRAQHVIKTANYELARANLTHHDFAGDNNDSSRRADAMLAAAASGVPYKGEYGTSVITEETADLALASIDSGFERLAKLTNPVWRPVKSHPQQSARACRGDQSK